MYFCHKLNKMINDIEHELGNKLNKIRVLIINLKIEYILDLFFFILVKNLLNYCVKPRNNKDVTPF